MLETCRILVRPLGPPARAGIACLAGFILGGCGQTGALYLPKEPAAAQRATLPQSLWPVMPKREQPANTTPTPTPPKSDPPPASTTDNAPTTVPASQ